MKPPPPIRSLLLACALTACAAPADDADPGPDPDAGATAVTTAPDLLAAARAGGFTAPSIAMVEWPAASPDVHRYDLRWDGVRVVGVGAVSGHGVPRPRLASPRLDLDAPPATTAAITADDAVARALARFDAKARARPVGDAELVLVPTFERRLRADVVAAGRSPTATDFERVIRRLELRWRVVVETGATASTHWEVAVDAITGAVESPHRLELEFDCNAGNGCVPVKGAGLYYDSTTMSARLSGSQFLLEDDHSNQIAALASDDTPLPIYSSPVASFGDGQPFTIGGDPRSINGQTAAVDAALSVEAAFHLDRDVLGLNGFDGHGLRALVRVHWQEFNAQWRPLEQEVWVGYAVPPQHSTVLRPHTAVDEIGHELGHAFFMQATGGDSGDGKNEFAGLNEATGDILGTLAEDYRWVAWGKRKPWPIDQIPPDGDWAIGDATGTVLRSMDAPAFPAWSPDIVVATGGDPHKICGPIDRMFYALTEGLSPTGGLYTYPRTSLYLPKGMTGVGLTKAAHMWRDVVGVIGPGADFAEVREAGITAMESIYGWPSVEQRALADAFAAVNVGPPADRDPPVISNLTAVQMRAVPNDPGSRVVRVTFSLDELPTRKAPRVLLDGARSYTPSNTKATTYSVDIPLADMLGLAKHTVTITAWDDWGNASTSSLTFFLDTAGPNLFLSTAVTFKVTTITAQASDPSGVARVEVRRDGAPVATLTAPPYTITFDSSTWTEGSHLIAFDAIDQPGNVTTATLTIVADNTAPLVGVVADGSAPPFTITGTATDASTMTTSQILIDGAVVATGASPPITASYAPQDALAHTITARVQDRYGNVGVATISAPKDHTPPQVTFQATQQAYAVTLAGVVTDSCGVTAPLTVIADGVQLGQPSGPLYSVVLPSGLFAPGMHTFELDASDRCGNLTAYHDTFAVYVNQPLVSLAVLPGPDKKHPRVTATVTHDRPIARVEFWRESGGTTAMIASDDTPPYDVNLDTSGPGWVDGNDEIQALAIDNLGISGVSPLDPSSSVFVDNTKPTVWSTYNQTGRVVNFVVTAVSDGLGSGVVAVDLYGFPWNLSSHRTAPPYQLQWVLPATQTSNSILFTGEATDAYGNTGVDGFEITITCSTTNGVETCSATRTDPLLQASK